MRDEIGKLSAGLNVPSLSPIVFLLSLVVVIASDYTPFPSQPDHPLLTGRTSCRAESYTFFRLHRSLALHLPYPPPVGLLRSVQFILDVR